MKKLLVTILKIVIPLGLGIFLIWMVYSKLKPKDIQDIKQSFQELNYFYLLLSVFFGLLSHASRAWRWKYPLQELGYTPRFWNSFFTVMIGYFANLGIPRSGEVLRCGLMSRYENIPFNRLVGTVIAERVADFLILMGFIASVLFIQFDTLKGYLIEKGFIDNVSPVKLLILLAIAIVFAIVGYLFLKKSTNTFVLKVKTFLSGILEGIKTILTMEHKWHFIGHTIFIWVMYVLMFYIAFFSLSATQDVSFGGIVTAFVIGGLSIAATNGGIGLYPLGVAEILVLYNVDFSAGYAFGWAVWVAQSVMLVAGGLVSFLLIPRFNSSKE